MDIYSIVKGTLTLKNVVSRTTKFKQKNSSKFQNSSEISGHSDCLFFQNLVHCSFTPGMVVQLLGWHTGFTLTC